MHHAVSLILTFGNLSEDVVKGLRDDAPKLCRFLFSLHCESLAAAGLTVCNDSACDIKRQRLLYRLLMKMQSPRNVPL